LIPCGNQPLHPRSPVPAAFHCVHHYPASSAAVGPEGAEERLPACAALAAGSINEQDLLTRAVGDDRWRVSELAAPGMQRVLAADWAGGLSAVRSWLRSGNPLGVRGRSPLLRNLRS
jgi:hypothetical protein